MKGITMRKQFKRALKRMANPVRQELLEELKFTQEEIDLMNYLYKDRTNQFWVADEMGISVSTLTNLHNTCIDKIINFFGFQKIKYEKGEINSFLKFFTNLDIEE